MCQFRRGRGVGRPRWVMKSTEVFGSPRFLQLLFPAGIGLVDLGGADVEPLKVGRFGFFGEELGQDAGFVAAATSEIEEGKVVLFREVRPEKVTKIRFLSFARSSLKEFGGKGCGPREEGNLRFGFWNLEITLRPWIYRSDQGATEKARDCER